MRKNKKTTLQPEKKYEADLNKKIGAAAETVRVQKKLDVILNKDNVVAGGVDVTAAVMQILK